MTNLLLMTDEQDEALGRFFYACTERVQNHSACMADCSTKVLKHQYLQTNIAFSSYIESLNDSDFICGAFMHGNESALYCGENTIITEEDSIKFRNSIAYFCSCYTGKKLLHSIVKYGRAYAAIGYKDAFYVQSLFYMENIFVECATSLFKFLFDGHSILESINLMKYEYTKAIDNNYSKDPFSASLLLLDRDSIVYYGNSNFTF